MDHLQGREDLVHGAAKGSLTCSVGEEEPVLTQGPSEPRERRGRIQQGILERFRSKCEHIAQMDGRVDLHRSRGASDPTREVVRRLPCRLSP